ncbi:coiled-coil domain-containing protein [Streptoalloteichus hindustanus]|uniref:hypothetical protein n=1 Tax=Streptoalloteichus hindustanus TaxID=2017 RepID=UPI0011610661|nr:hypothetical protein [Streptoalloteichus hindustanus]
MAAPLGEYSPARVDGIASSAHLSVVAPTFPLGAELAHYYGGDRSVDGREFFSRGLGEGPEQDHPVLPTLVRVSEDVPAGLVAWCARQPLTAVRDRRSRDRLVAAGVGEEIAVVPNPAVLLGDLASPSVLVARVGHLRQLGELPDSEFLVVHVVSPVTPDLVAAVERVRDRLGAVEIVVLTTGVAHDELALPPAWRLIGTDLVVEDRLAVLDAARAVIAADEHVAAVSSALGQDWVLLDPTGEQRWPVLEFAGEDQVVTHPEEILSAAFAPPDAADRLASAQRVLKSHLDRIAQIAQDALAARGGDLERRMADLAGENHALRTAHRRLRERMLVERQALVDELATTWQEGERVAREADELREQLARLRAELAHERELHAALAARHRDALEQRAAVESELATLRQTKLLRWSEPLREVYGKIRRP